MQFTKTNQGKDMLIDIFLKMPIIFKEFSQCYFCISDIIQYYRQLCEPWHTCLRVFYAFRKIIHFTIINFCDVFQFAICESFCTRKCPNLRYIHLCLLSFRDKSAIISCISVLLCYVGLLQGRFSSMGDLTGGIFLQG